MEEQNEVNQKRLQQKQPEMLEVYVCVYSLVLIHFTLFRMNVT
jgi:hypothetical protein